jgi:DNA-binding NtrC family response regulator
MNILLVDDEHPQRTILAGYLKKKRHAVFEAANLNEAVACFTAQAIDAVVTDFQMPDGTGLELLKRLRALHGNAFVVMMTAFGTIERAVEAMREGAFDYLTKPINLQELEAILRRIQEFRHLQSENQSLREQLAERHSFAGIVSQSSEMARVLSAASRVAPSSASVLVRGESGTGKELIARAIHFASARSDRPFVAVNSAALNDNLLESELFGHEKGAFTGADKQRRGRFEMADGGTLFLDEVGELSPATQGKLLRVLQEHQFERLGGSETIAVDVRIIAATNRNLEEAIARGGFREDLFYRLNVVAIDVPPLRERRDDIPPLLEHFLQKFSRENKRRIPAFSKESWEALLRYDYPGNIRELENIVHRAVVMCRDNFVTTEDLPQVLRTSSVGEHGHQRGAPASLVEQVELLEKDLVFEALRLSGDNQSKAAQQLGISERNLRYRLKKWGLK